MRFQAWDLSPNWKPVKKQGGQFIKGQSPWNKGKKMSMDLRKALSKVHVTTGSTSESKLSRTNVDFKDWREKVFKQDDYTCRKCKIRGGTLNAHHVASFSKFIDLRYDTDNGVTLCENCHRLFHKTYGLKKFRFDDIYPFLYKDMFKQKV